VSVICPKGIAPYKSSYEKLEGVEIYRHSRWEASGTAGYLVEYLLALVAELYLAFRVFVRTRFRILQACNPPDTIFLIALLLKPFGVRFIFDHHDLTPELFESKVGASKGLLYRIIRLAEFCTFRVADVCIATNESFKEIAITRGGKHSNRVFVVRNCPDVTRPCRLRLLSTPNSGTFLVVYVGFMGSQDGLDLLLESINHIVKYQKRSDTHFLLVGTGTELPKLRAYVADNELASFVTFTGQVPHAEVGRYLEKADIGVAPDPKTSMNDKSTMIKILEYMAYGLPVVLFDLKEGRRIADSAALYASPNDPIDFANKVEALLNCQRLRRDLGECGRKRVESRLNWNIEKRLLLDAYAAALGEAGHSSLCLAG
jgi:glycosyltransferase involved in cell wall biosynthesis